MPRGDPRVTVSMRVETDLWQRMKLMAVERGVSLSRLARSVFRAELARWETPARLRDRAKTTEEEER